MPTGGDVAIAASVERTHAPALISAVGGDSPVPLDFACVTKVESRTGILASRAFVQLTNLFATDETGAITIDDGNYYGPTKLKMLSRVLIEYDGGALFVGNLAKRRDLGLANKIVLEYWDDRLLLAKLPLRGALVRDPYDEAVKLAPRYAPHMNLDGYRNCVKAKITGLDSPVWVFAPYAEAGVAGTTGADDDPAFGVACEWTPARALNYLWAYAHFNAGAFYSEKARLDTTKVLWLPPFFSADTDMHSKLPEMNFRGQQLLGALLRVLDAGGSYGLALEPRSDGKARVAFYPRNADDAAGSGAVTIPLQRAGAASDIKTAYDFTAETDATDLCTGIVAEGATAKLEQEFKFIAKGNDANTLVHAWTDAEEADFKAVINGNGTYAKAPKQPGQADSGATPWDLYDGTGGRPAIQFQSNAALALARQCFAKPFRAYKIPGDTSTAGGAAVAARMDGYGDQLEGAPLLAISRAILPEQLQPFFETAGDKRGYLRWPVRVQVAGHDADYNNGLRVYDDGLIYLDGLTDDVGDSNNLIYTGSLAAAPDGVALREVKINAAVPHDARLKSARDIFWAHGEDPNEIQDQVDPSVSREADGVSLQHYVLCPEAYLWEHQMASKPMGTEALTALLRYDATELDGFTARKLKEVAALKKTQLWHLIGIRPEYSAGLFLTDVEFQGADGKYPVNRPIGSVVWDFEGHETVVRPE